MLLFIQFYPLSLVSTRLHDKTFSVFYHVNVDILARDNLFSLPVDNTVPVRVFGDSFDRFGILAATQVEAFNADISVTRNNQLGFFYGSTSGKTILFPFSTSNCSHNSGRASRKLVWATLNTRNTCILG